ncbi:MAG: NAD-dependent epimerase/dehydratase family protein, partial [Deinococcota bacterium]|nr:NAD-dependent epimerase/dehydratase family protein [Deinococcota bacterium]
MAGCIGSWIAKHLLEHGHEVFGIDLTTDDTKHRLLGITGAFPLHKVDVCD